MSVCPPKRKESDVNLAKAIGGNERLRLTDLAHVPRGESQDIGQGHARKEHRHDGMNAIRSVPVVFEERPWVVGVLDVVGQVRGERSESGGDERGELVHLAWMYTSCKICRILGTCGFCRW